MKKLNFLVLLSIFAALVLIPNQQADAYTTFGAAWPSGSTVNFNINYANPQGLDPAAIKVDVDASLEAWPAQAGIKLTMKDAGSTNITQTTTYDYKNIIIFRDDSGSGYIARTYSWASGSTIVDSDVVFNTLYAQNTSNQACTGYFIQNTLTHELGHAIGMGHSDVGTATMYPSEGGCETIKQTLDPDDIAGVQTLYATGTNPPPPPPGPTPPPPPPPPSGSHINLSPSSLSFSASAGSTPAAQSVTLSNSGTATMNWTGSANQTWCHVSPTSGSLGASASGLLSVSVDAQQSGGSLSCSIAVSDLNADNSPQYINVGYTVTGPPDTTPPTVSLTQPFDGTRVSGKTAIAASASDASGIAKVEFYIDNKLVATDTSSPYTYSWNVNKPVPAGAHTITAKAYDKASPANTATSSVTVTK